MILLAIFCMAVVLIICGHTAITVTRSADRVVASNQALVTSNETLARAIAADANQKAFDRMGARR